MKLFISYMKNVVTYELKKTHMWNYSGHIWNPSFHIWNPSFNIWNYLFHMWKMLSHMIWRKIICEIIYVKYEIWHFICEFLSHIWNSSFHIWKPWFHIWNSNFICELTYEIFVRVSKAINDHQINFLFFRNAAIFWRLFCWVTGHSSLKIRLIWIYLRIPYEQHHL